MSWLQKGDEFLPNISKGELKSLYRLEKNAKGKLRLVAAIQRREGKTLEDIVSSLQKPKTTIHDWLQRLESKGIGHLYDIKQPGKPAQLTKTQEKELENMLDQSPEKQGIPHTMWTTKLVQYIILKRFNIKFNVRHVRNIVKKINFSLQIPRPENIKANKQAQEKFKRELKKKFNITLNGDSRSSVLMKRTSS